MLGLDLRAGLEQARQKRLPPAIDWPAQVPGRTPPIGPSSSGRALPFGADPGLLPGTVYHEQKRLIGDILSPSLKEALRGAANAFVDSVRSELNNAVRSVRVADLGSTMRTALAPQKIAGLLPAGVGREPSRYSGVGGGESRAEMMARRTAEAYAKSALRGMDVMGGGAGRPAAPYNYAYRSPRPRSAMVPYGAGGALVATGGGGAGAPPPNRPPSGGMGGFGGAGGFGRALAGVNLPGAGMVREIGNEFAMATKQVLLFGTAYKALAFATSFPAQVRDAVAALQSFRNTLNAISPTAAEAVASNQFILDTVNKYNIPLQSARDGFTKLYASMQPAGFSGEQIKNLYLGISKASATLGLSSDKVDRVTYAFAQMASKGQLMAEEVTGQLGDVIPGALSIMAEAAQMDIKTFKKAMEDGAFTGKAFEAVMSNVPIVMEKRFGKGAEGAAKTFQGALNNMQTSITGLYEAFEPVAVGFLNAVVVPMTSGIKVLSDGFSAFFKGVNAQTTGGFAIAKELEKLRPTFEGIRTNVVNLLPTLQSLGEILLGVSKVFLQIASNPLTGYLAKLYAIFLPLNIALNVMRGLWAANSLQLVIFNARIATGTSTLSAFRGMMAATGATSKATATAIRGAGLTLRAFFASTGVGLVLVGISALIERFMSLNQRLDETRGKALGAGEAIRLMSQTEARIAGQQAQADAQVIKGLIAKGKGKELLDLSARETTILERYGPGNITRSPLGTGAAIEPSQLPSLLLKAQENAAKASARTDQIAFEERQSQLSTALSPIPTEISPSQRKATEESAEKTEKDRVRYESEFNRLLQENLEINNRRGNIEKDELSQIEAKIELAKQLLKLSLENIRLTETGKIQTQATTNAIASYQLTVAELNDDWDATIKKIGTIEKQAKDLESSILGQQVIGQTPLQKALADIDDQAQSAIEKIDELLGSLKGVAGTRPESLSARVALGDLRASFTGRTPEESNLLASRQVTRSAKEQLTSRLQELRSAGQETTTLDQVISQIGEDWNNLAPQVKQDLSEIASQIDAAAPFAAMASAIKEARDRLNELLSPLYLASNVADSISSSFGEAFSNMITGSSSVQQAFAKMFQSISDSFANMVSQMISQWLKTQILQGFQRILGMAAPSLGPVATAAGIVPRAGFYGPAFAMGGIAKGGFQAFASGGIVTGPTMGLVGEGRYNEAVVPLPDGKSIPVDLGGGAGASTTNVIVNVDAKGTNAQGNEDVARQLGGVISVAVQSEIVRQQRPGGLLASSR